MLLTTQQTGRCLRYTEGQNASTAAHQASSGSLHCHNNKLRVDSGKINLKENDLSAHRLILRRAAGGCVGVLTLWMAGLLHKPSISREKEGKQTSKYWLMFSSLPDLPAAASLPASPPPARRSAPEICLFLPSFWQNAPLSSLLLETKYWQLVVSTRSQICNNLCSSPVTSFIPAGSTTTVVWPVGWRWLHHPLPGGGNPN